MNAVLTMLLTWMPLSLATLGGPLVILPDVHRLVTSNGWMTDREFAEVFAIAQALPGPNLVFFAAVGWFAAGLTGAFAALFAVVAPPCAIAYGFARTWARFSDRAWSGAIQRGLAPVVVGLVAASAVTLMAAAAGGSIAPYVLGLGVAALAYLTRIHLLVMLAAAAVLGVLGVVGGA